ncbi:type II secretion system F family protein [Patescibacteria group bacterium]|nr:type II secretion system F family protein [Patescibacteria group bacterium]MBU4023107.1 type II secretion system F family protein [Patescibacteria group bacterium]MBU4078351.1 type II secretion system F family protein [Patescibacteria group bacterium]
MPLYNFTAKALNKETRKGRRQAENRKVLAQELKQEGCFLISATIESRAPKFKNYLPKIRYVALKEKLLATRNLQVMVAAGVSLPRTLEILSKQTKSKYFKDCLKEMREMILKGTSFSEAITKFPKIFPEIYASMVKVGEKTGELDKVLGILAQQLERNYRLRSSVRGAMMYPAVILSAMILIGIVMMIKVVPQISKTFDELEIELPAITKAVIAISNVLAEKWYLLILGMIFLFLFSYFFTKSKKGKKAIDRTVLRIPILSPLVKKINSAYTALSLSALVKGGVPIILAINIAADSVNNVFYKAALQSTAKKVEKGEKMSIVMAEYTDLYSPLFIQMLQVGEETGQTSEMLEKLASFLEEDVDNRTKNLSTIIEPLLLLLIGGAVALFAVSFVQPIYSIMQGI